MMTVEMKSNPREYLVKEFLEQFESPEVFLVTHSKTSLPLILQHGLSHWTTDKSADFVSLLNCVCCTAKVCSYAKTLVCFCRFITSRGHLQLSHQRAIGSGALRSRQYLENPWFITLRKWPCLARASRCNPFTRAPKSLPKSLVRGAPWVPGLSHQCVHQNRS